jgi:hypothetical protein
MSSLASVPFEEPAALADSRAALRDGRLWSVAAPFAMALARQVRLLLYRVSYLTPALGKVGTSVTLMSTTVASVTGRLGLGRAIDRLPRRATSAGAFAQATAVGLMVALPREPLFLWLGSALFGLYIGNVLTHLLDAA